MLPRNETSEDLLNPLGSTANMADPASIMAGIVGNRNTTPSMYSDGALDPGAIMASIVQQNALQQAQQQQTPDGLFPSTNYNGSLYYNPALQSQDPLKVMMDIVANRHQAPDAPATPGGWGAPHHPPMGGPGGGWKQPPTGGPGPAHPPAWGSPHQNPWGSLNGGSWT
jgi:hypothetical protein